MSRYKTQKTRKLTLNFIVVLKRSPAIYTYNGRSYDFLACALNEAGIRVKDFGEKHCVWNTVNDSLPL
jgi:hypothetical protein